MQKVYPKIYKRDTRGALRVWFMEQDGAQYRTHAGLADGSIVTSKWTVAQPTNVGRANERDGVAQATFEIEAAYEHKLTREYHRTVEATEGGAHFFKPMLAGKFDRTKFESGYVQPKLDGMRCIATAGGLWSRQGKPIISCQHIEDALAPLFETFPDLILDGELYNHDLKDNFGKIMSLVKKQTLTDDQAAEVVANVEYHIYDVPSEGEEPFFRRYMFLSDLFADYVGPTSPLVQVMTTEARTIERFDHLHGLHVGDGYEGSIFRLNAPYEQKRSKHLLKRKDFDDSEFDVVEIQEGEGNWSGAAKRVVCWLPGVDRAGGPTKENTFEAGIRGTYERGVELLQEHHSVVTVRHFGWTDTDIPKPRFGVVTAFHGDKREY